MSYDYDKFGNLASRKDNLRNLEETFLYDNMNRLTDIYLGNTHSQIVYDPLGRMTDKEADGQTVFANADFTAAPGQPTRPHAMTGAETTEDTFPAATQSIGYTSFDKVKAIVEDGNYILYTYGYDQQRIHLTESVDGVMRLKEYVGVCEFVTDDYTNNCTQRSFTYLVGPYGVFAAVEKQDSAETIHYILKDHLGSWTTITDAEGNVEREVSFDAWGNLRDPDTWLNYSTTDPVEAPMFDRGFTGHEHITAFGLVNMNGRCYDPMTSHFLSVDAYVQDPTSAQSFNRYAYCMHNPLRYTDPTGWQSETGRADAANLNHSHDETARWHSEDINDVLWGRSVHPCETGNPYWTNSTITTYSQGNRGIFGCNFTVDKQGYITNVGRNEKPCDVLYTQECWDNNRMDIFVELPIGILAGRKTNSGEGTNGITYTFDMYEFNDNELSTEVFEFLATNTNVEWSQTYVGNPKSQKSFLSTSHNVRTEAGQAYLFHTGYTILEHNHSHPYHDYPSQSDLFWAKTVHTKFQNVVLKILYKNNYYEYDEFGLLTPPGVETNLKKELQVVGNKVIP